MTGERAPEQPNPPAPFPPREGGAGIDDLLPSPLGGGAGGGVVAPNVWRCAVAEAVGTFFMVFAGTGAIVVNATYGGIGHIGIALTFGLVVLAMIYAVGDVSGAHLNPAVTLGFAAAGRFAWRRVPAYVVSQAAGALGASFLLAAMFPEHATLGATLPAGSAGQAWVMEFLLSLMLMLVILGVSTGSLEKGLLAGVAVGAAVGLEAMFAGPVCGASMNPIRSLAPALASGRIEHLWVYLTAPFAGMVAAVALGKFLRPEGATS